MRLKGKVAIVTGAASGIGRSVAQVFAREGCHLALVVINEAGLNETLAGLSGVEAIAAPADVSRSADVQWAIDLKFATKPPFLSTLFIAQSGGFAWPARMLAHPPLGCAS